ncbi:phage tail tape measure protein [Nocardia cyriacigeorgica]|uniref:Phage tail tape measure protein n=2 Tax=Nocardia cyriacigeorgica TaxID=135487 RepID=A0ABX0CJJ3_9NOCA|nr:phage tail tape measure protein [Nocardia cyriacigeorgica]NEW50997.1 phage tail tape measure protein [Nocardia cyriacigeorgica]NEW54420.1 phage tail tape measure protein [Nocardia cyriacigeorgica]
MGLALGGAAAFAKVIEIGNEFTTNLNTMKAVASATATEMEAVSERAKQLGNDITLPGTSANDAAAAMNELAKGGFSVRQSMDAAKGSLQLAAAAQVDAAEAARIQSSALQAFGLQASEAGRVADVLANTSNASAAEITEVAYALQSGGAVAHQFGLTVEDTAAAIGMLANSGIRGSDAGTLLKSALLALTDQGKPAREAIRELGLTVYDSRGNFIGLRSLIEQLDTAAGRMTPEMYQAATATLFGSDAMRLAAIAADKGVVGFDNMHRAMSRQGAAADVAAAKMQGLPGAMQTVTNAAENLALEVYDLVKGPLEQYARGAAERITSATPTIVAGLHGAADAAVDVGRAIAPVVGTIADLPAPVLAAAAAFVVFKTTALGSWLTNGAAAMQRVGASTLAVATASGRVVQVAGTGAATLGRFGSAINQLGASAPVVQRMQTSFLNAAAGANTFARAQGTIAAATTGARAAAGGLVSMLGGPWVVAIVAAGAALFQLWSEMKKSEEHAKAVRNALREIGQVRSELSEIFALNKGAINDQAIQNVTRQIGIMKQSMEEAANFRPGFFEKGFQLPWASNAKDKEWYADRWAGAKKLIDDLKMSDQQLAETLSDTSKFNDLTAKLNGMGQDGRFAVSELTALRDEIAKSRDVAQNTTPGFATLSQAVQTLSDQSASAADRIDAMKTALDVLSGKPIAAQDALAQYNAQVRDTAAATSDVWDAAKGWGDALIGVGGQVNTTTENGGRLYDELMKIRDATITAAEAGVDMGPVLAQNQAAFAALAAATGLNVDQVAQMATQLGYLPRDIEILAQLRGADSVEQQLTVIEGLLRVNANGVEIPVEALTEEAKAKLDQAGAAIDEVNGKPGIVKVSAPDLAAVLAELQKLINTNLPSKTQKVVVEYEDRGAALQRQGLPEGFVGPVVQQPRADGGIDGALPSQATIKSPQSRLYQWAEPETGGEAFIPLATSKRARSVDILGQVAGMFGFGLTKMADGGIATTRALDFLRGQSGKDYQYGGVGNPSWDCSAFISAAYALLKGLDPYVRWFTTESDFGALGFLPGLDPTGRGLSIGVYRGGGGQYSHMAGLLAGTPLESGANGVQVGSGAQSAASGELPLKFYLPASAFNPPESGGGRRSRRSRTQQDTWDEGDDLELESARLSARQAAIARDEALADPDKTAEDKRQAEIRARQAELRVQEMEKDKTEATSTGGPVPEAPPLTGSMTDDEIRLADLQDSLDEAKFERDEVYADPMATDAERAAADRDVYGVMNAIAAEQKKQRESAAGAFGTGSGSVVDLFGEAAKSFVTGQLSDVLTVAGLGGDVKGVIGAGIGIAAELEKKRREDAPSPAAASKEDLAKQGPVVPGTANWMQELMKTLVIPAVIRDSGGPLPNNTAAINTSGETEWVLTGAQMRAAAAARPAPQPNVDASIRIDNLNTGMSASEFQREWKMVQLDQRDRSRALVRR